MTRDPATIALGAKSVLVPLKQDMQFTCAVRDPATGTLYIGTTHGVVILEPTGKVHHVKLRGETFRAGAANEHGIWFAGDEHLVQFESGKPRTTKLARKDFGMQAGAVTCLYLDGADVWLGLRHGGASRSPRGGFRPGRAEPGESPLFRLEVAQRRVHGFHRCRKELGGTIRGIVKYAGRICVLTDERLVWPLPDGLVQRVLELAPATDNLAVDHARNLLPLNGLHARVRELVDRPFMYHAGDGLVGRDAHGMFMLRSDQGPPLEPWPVELALLGTAAVRDPGASWFVATPLGLVESSAAGTLHRLGSVPIVMLVPGAPVLALTADAIVALEPQMPGGEPFEPDLAALLPDLAREALRSGGVPARCAALRVLKPTSATEEVEPVLAALADVAPAVRAAACQMVAQNHVIAARQKLLELADEPIPAVRTQAVLALLALGETSASARLVDCLRDASVDEARRMLRELTADGGRPALDVLRPFVLDDRPVVRRSALLWLGKLGFPRAILGAIAQLERTAPEDREAGVRNLSHSKDPIVTYLLAAHLSDAAPAVRRAALIALALVAEHQELPAEVRAVVTRALGGAIERAPEDGAVCAAVVELAAILGEPLPQGTVERALSSEAAPARRAAVQLVQRQHRRDLLPAVIERLSDADVDVRGAAVDALGRLGDVRALKPLMALLDDPRLFAQQLIGEPGPRAVTRAMARILAADVPVEVELGGHEEWVAWYSGRLRPMLERFGLA